MQLRIQTRDSPSITTYENGGKWCRDFDGHVTTSHLSYSSGRDQVIERFGPLRLALGFDAGAGRLQKSVASLHFFGLPMPRVPRAGQPNI